MINPYAPPEANPEPEPPPPPPRNEPTPEQRARSSLNLALSAWLYFSGVAGLSYLLGRGFSSLSKLLFKEPMFISFVIAPPLLGFVAFTYGVKALDQGVVDGRWKATAGAVVGGAAFIVSVGAMVGPALL